MYDITEYEMEKNISQILNKVEKGESIIITKEGKPMAELKPVSNQTEVQILAKRKEAVENMLKMRDENGAVDLDKIMQKAKKGRQFW
jgi:prevent-host-death family protein